MDWRGICWIAVVTFESSQQGMHNVHLAMPIGRGPQPGDARYARPDEP